MAWTSQAKSVAGARGLPVLLTSGYAEAAMPEASRNDIRVLRKPYDIRTLAKTFGAVLASDVRPA